jgi:hypothetical protein
VAEDGVAVGEVEGGKHVDEEEGDGDRGRARLRVLAGAHVGWDAGGPGVRSHECASRGARIAWDRTRRALARRLFYGISGDRVRYAIVIGDRYPAARKARDGRPQGRPAAARLRLRRGLFWHGWKPCPDTKAAGLGSALPTSAKTGQTWATRGRHFAPTEIWHVTEAGRADKCFKGPNVQPVRCQNGLLREFDD